VLVLLSFQPDVAVAGGVEGQAGDSERSLVIHKEGMDRPRRPQYQNPGSCASGEA